MSLIGTGSPIGRPAGIGQGTDNSDNPEHAGILEEMRNRFEYAGLMDQENRENYLKSARISSSNDQWDEQVKKRRGSNRPALTFNILNLVVKQIIGDYRQNKMSIKVLPSGGPATDDTADILGDIIRGIEMDSNAEESYTNSLECSARGNIGYFRLLPEYESDDAFTQKLVIKPVKNPLTVRLDPLAKLITRHDAEWAFITEMMSKEEFKRLYPKASEMGWDIIDLDSDSTSEWGDDKEIRLVEYFTKERIKARLVAFDNGAVIQIDKPEEIEALAQIGINPVKERTATRINIKWRKCTGNTILEERTFKTKYIPIIPVLGEEVNIEGKTLLRSAVYYGIDAQHSYNFERSTAIENSSLTAKAPWKVTHKMIEMWRDQWDNANTTPQPYLIYTPDPAVPQGPERIEPPNPSAAAMQNAQTAALDVQRTTGVFNSQVGEQTNVQSGVGLSEQQSQGQTSTYIFLDNLRSGIEHCGRILVDWIPEFYDTDRVVRTINSEDDIEMQRINEKRGNPLLGITEVLNDIRIGEYDVVVTAGKAFASRRREAVDGMMKFAQHFPQQAPLIADQMIENMDIPGGEVMAARLKRALPPNIINDPDSPEGQKAAQEAQQKQQQAEQLQQQMLQSKIQVEQGKNQASMAKSNADVQKANAEVIKAKSDIIIAGEEAHTSKIEHAASILDQTRIESPQGAASAGVPPQPPAAPTRTPYGSRQEDFAKAHQKDEADMKNAEDIKQMLTGLAHHMLTSHQQNQQMIGNLAHSTSESHKNIANGLAHAAAIASAPIEAVRDKTGRIVGSRKVLEQQVS